MFIIGLDPGLQRTGYGVIEIDGVAHRLVDAGLITTSTKSPLPDRVATIHESLCELFKEYPNVAAVAIEDLYSHYKHPKTSVLMAHARGVMLLAARQAGIEVISFAATMIKKAVVGTGHATKSQVQHAVIARFGVKTDQEIPADVTDALAVAVCCSEHLSSVGGAR